MEEGRTGEKETKERGRVKRERKRGMEASKSERKEMKDYRRGANDWKEKKT